MSQRFNHVNCFIATFCIKHSELNKFTDYTSVTLSLIGTIILCYQIC